MDLIIWIFKYSKLQCKSCLETWKEFFWLTERDYETSRIILILDFFFGKDRSFNLIVLRKF